MPNAFLTRTVGFAAAHHYYRPEWSAARNRTVFGACSNAHGHGHNYRLAVTVQAPVDSETGFSVDLGELDRVLAEQVVAVLDHQHLNHAVPEFHEGGAIPTCENIASWIWSRLRPALPAGVQLHRVRLHEDERLYVDYYGGEAS